MKKPASTVEDYRQHRISLLRAIGAFTDGMAKLSRLSEEAARYGETITAVASQTRSGVPDAALLADRLNERLVDLLVNDAEATMFQRTWRVVLTPTASPSPRPAIEVFDDYFVEPVESLTARHRTLHRLDPERFLVVDREAGQKSVIRALPRLMRQREPGAVSRLPSDPPFVLVDARREHDFQRLDLAIVKVCMNGPVPDDFAQIVIADLYPTLARRCGYKHGARLPRYAPEALKWARFLRLVRRRWKSLLLVLSPVPATT